MSNRSYHKKHSQGVNYVEYDVQMRSYGATHPVFVEGNAGANAYLNSNTSGTSVPVPTGQATGPYLNVQRGVVGITGASGAQNPVPYGVTGTTGSYVITTKDPFVALVTKFIDLSWLLPGTGVDYKAVFGQEFQQADGTWVIPFSVYQNTSGTYAQADLPADAANRISVQLCFRNSNAKP
jgi:hypothetical protein